jgi:hypothetical protein
VAQDERVAVVRGELDLLPHGVLILIEAEEVLSDVHAEVDDGSEEQQHDETAE